MLPMVRRKLHVSQREILGALKDAVERSSTRGESV
jgi:hypothetical protein